MHTVQCKGLERRGKAAEWRWKDFAVCRGGSTHSRAQSAAGQGSAKGEGQRDEKFSQNWMKNKDEDHGFDRVEGVKAKRQSGENWNEGDIGKQLQHYLTVDRAVHA